MVTAKKAAGTVGTVLLDKVDPATVDRYLAKAGLPTDGTIEARVGRLVASQAKVSKAHIGDCDTCHGASDVREPVCVFCGTGDEDDQTAAAVAANPNATIDPPTKASKKRSESVAPEAVEAPARKKYDPPKLVRVEPPPPAATKAKKSTPPPAVPAQLVAKSAGPAKGGAITVADLDANVAQIQSLRRDAVVCYWRLGRAIFENFEGRLYTQRVDDEGVPKYKAFNQFVVAELGLSVSHAYALMDVAVNFDEKDVATVGVAKLTLVARLPPADRGELLERIRSQNTPLSQVIEEVRRLAGGNRAESAASRGGGKGFAGDATAGNRAQTANKSSVTVGLYLGRQTIQMMRKDAPDRQASTIAHDPYAVELHVNGVTTEYRVIKQETGLALVITRTRDPGAKAVEPEPEKPAKAKVAKAKPAKAPKAKPAKAPAKPPKASSSTGKPKPSKKA
jgi:hypothetical protein